MADNELAMGLFAETSMGVTNDLVPPVPWFDPAKVQVEGKRIRMYADNGYFQASPAIRRAVEEAAGALRQRGATVESITAPDTAEGMWLSATGGRTLCWP